MITTARRKTLLYLLIALLMLLPIGIYIWHFHSYPISDNPADWGTFGDYIGGIYSVLVAILAIYISHHLEIRRKHQLLRIDAAKDLYNQILTVKKNNYNPKSIAKLQRLIGSSDLYLKPMILDKATALADNYLRHKSDNEEIDDDLQQETLQELERIYAR